MPATIEPGSHLSATQAVDVLDKAGETNLADMGRAALDALTDPAAAKALAEKYGIGDAGKLMDGLKLVAEALSHSGGGGNVKPADVRVMHSYEDVQKFEKHLVAMAERGHFSEAAALLKAADFSQGDFMYGGGNERTTCESALAQAIEAKGGNASEFGLSTQGPMMM